MQILNNPIKAKREKHNWTQLELAEKTGLSVRTIQRLESGQTEPKGHTLKVLEVAFKETLTDNFEIPKEAKLINLSCLSMLIIPFGNIVFPITLWLKHKEDKSIDSLGRQVINFQITWYLATSVMAAILVVLQPYVQFNIIVWGMVVLVFINVASVTKNAMHLQANRKNIYKRAIKFL